MIFIYMSQMGLCQNESTCLDTNNEFGYFGLIAGYANQHSIDLFINPVKAG